MNAPSTGGGGPPQTREAYRASVDQWRRQALSERNQYEPRVQRQIQQYFADYSPPWYVSIIGYRRQFNLLVAQSRATGCAATLGRSLKDEETKALGEHTLHNIHLNAGSKWAMLGLAAYLTYRGRHTWQFPFYKPKLGGWFNPYEATSIIGNKKIRGLYPQLIWHSVRFTAYAAVTLLMVAPVFRSINFVWTEQAMARDPRLQQFTKDASARVEEVFQHGPHTRQHVPQQSEDDIYGSGDEQPSDDQNYSQSYASETTKSKSWDSMSRNTQTQPVQSQQPDSRWGGAFDDDDDDASPIASSTRTQPSTTHTGSSWDRLRQQSQPSRQPQSQTQGSWARASQQSQSQSEWGAENAGTSPEYRGPRESYSYSQAEQERATPKEQAQQDFDRLLERERSGVDQERSWGRS